MGMCPDDVVSAADGHLQAHQEPDDKVQGGRLEEQV
jgi:hypothetical protein